ncbi:MULTISPECIES: type IV pilus secretin PilQ [unclassified Neisseria]|uniref:type IV pilus secretin PilQ n=1 Tax=unclassified Neisseria TaxID=2623750 RepID=UPI0010724FE1|nr:MULTISPECIES: type IV pilus secretin PilQ [unclassified Neisseria]MBF0803501.1 type IV pilus secretin PilQ [Neisseria sp. 19428wB4_WF04]TFU43787.1 type IV pilus secretin PilQ [Neisseria sp. WF04]
MNSRNIKKIFAAISIGFAVQTAFAGNITDINVSSLPNNQKIIKIKFDKDAATPRGFITTTPARIALDFSNTNVQLPQPVLEYADPLINQITAAQNNDRTRILLGLNKAGQYNTEIKGNEVWVYVSEAAGQTTRSPQQPANPAAAAPAAFAAASPTRREQAVASANIDFRKGARNSGIVELSALGFTGQPDIKKQSDRITVTLKNHPLPAQAQRSLDVSDFNTPVRNVTMKRIGNDTQLVIRNQGSWDVDTQSANGRFSFEISRKANIASQGLSATPNKSFNGRKISLDFQDVEVRTILQILAKESGMNIVASDTVNGKMTLSLKDVPWDQALDLVMQARNLDMRRQGNIINVAPREELLAKDKATLQAQKEIDDLGPLLSQTFQLKYKNVEEFRKILRLDESGSSSDRNTLLSGRGSALIDPATNTLIITDNRTVIQKFQKLIDELDVPTRQVMVEARIVEANDGFARDIGVKFGYTGINGRSTWASNWADATGNTTTNYNNNLARANAILSGSNTIPSASPLTMNPNISLPVSAATSSIALVRAVSSGALGLELAAMQEQSKGKIISNPRVLTQDRKEATIESGSEIPYEEATSSGATSISFKKAVLGLTVTPNITPEGQVIMTVKINRDSPSSCISGGVTTTCISTKQLQTQAMVEDGGTLIVGGIYEEENGSTVAKVPLLGDIPVLGNLFKSRTRNEKRRELLIFITPRIMDHVGSNLRY